MVHSTSLSNAKEAGISPICLRTAITDKTWFLVLPTLLVSCGKGAFSLGKGARSLNGVLAWLPQCHVVGALFKNDVEKDEDRSCDTPPASHAACLTQIEARQQNPAIRSSPNCPNPLPANQACIP